VPQHVEPDVALGESGALADVIQGKVGQIYAYDSARLAVMLLDLTPTMWFYRRKACLSEGMQMHQDGDSVGTLLFDSTDPGQVRLAMKVAQAKKPGTCWGGSTEFRVSLRTRR